jgi:glycosyl hydrolase family 64 (putative beta-1,3-glucanase)
MATRRALLGSALGAAVVGTPIVSTVLASPALASLGQPPTTLVNHTGVYRADEIHFYIVGTNRTTGHGLNAGLFSPFFDPYIDSMWNKYQSTPFRAAVDGKGTFTGRVTGGRFDFDRGVAARRSSTTRTGRPATRRRSTAVASPTTTPGYCTKTRRTAGRTGSPTTTSPSWRHSTTSPGSKPSPCD